MEELIPGVLGLHKITEQTLTGDDSNAWASIANACIDRAFDLFQRLDAHPENFDQMAGLVRLAMDIDAHTKSFYQEDSEA